MKSVVVRDLDHMAPPCPRIDVHCHVGMPVLACLDADRFAFEPADVPEACDSFLSAKLAGGIRMWLARRVFRLPASGTGDESAAIENVLLRHILSSRLLDRVVVLAFDRYHTANGRALGPKAGRRHAGSDLYVSNTYVRHLWRLHPERILFGASIHPYRRTGDWSALDMLDEIARDGAVLVKWLPLVQNIDVEDSRSVAFLRRAAEIGMPMLIHYGDEKTLSKQHPEFEDPSSLLRVLRRLRAEGCMPTVIVAHVATPSLWPFDRGRGFRTLVDALLHEFAEAPLYADTAALSFFVKAHWLKQIAALPELHDKLVHGSDFPIPPTPLAFRFRLGAEYQRILAQPSWLDRDVAVKFVMGLGDTVLRRGGEILAHRIRHADGLAGRV